MAAAAYDATAISLHQAMERMRNPPPPPPHEGAHHRRGRILVAMLPVAEAPALVRALDIRAATWEAVNVNAVRAMAMAATELDLLALAVLPSRVDTPYCAGGNNPNLDWLSVCEQQLRQRALTVGGSFEAEVTALCGAIRSHVGFTPSATEPWIKRDAKRLLKWVTDIRKAAYSLSAAELVEN